MNFILLTPDLVEVIHDAVLNPGELPGRARDTSLERALGRVDNRLAYGLIADSSTLPRPIPLPSRWAAASTMATNAPPFERWTSALT